MFKKADNVLGSLTFLQQLLSSNVLNLWHIMVLQVGDWCIPMVVLSSFLVRIQLDLDCFVLFCFSGQKIISTLYKYIRGT